MDILTLPVRSITSTATLDRIVLEVGLEDLKDCVKIVAAQVITEQIRLGNPPSNIIVDGRGRTPIDQATRRVQAFFADRAAIRAAVYDAWNRIQALTRVATGRAAGSYQLWFKENMVGHSPAPVEIYVDRMNPATDYFRIVGPVLVYGRKIYWNPKGKPRFRKIRLIRTKTIQINLRRIRGIMDQVEQTLKRKYKYLAITEDWVTTTALPKDGRTPGLYIGFRKRGFLRKGS